MADKNFGYYTNRNTVKNPLLSTAVTGLSIEDLTHNAVLLPVSETQVSSARQDQFGSQPCALGQSAPQHTNLPAMDANSNAQTSNFTAAPQIYSSNIEPTLKHDRIPDMSHPTVSKASAKSEDDFDVNEYFARLQGTRYVSAPANSLLKDEANANLEEKEQNLEEINLNEPEKVPSDYQQSLTADIAQNFSQLPSVLPQVASAVFSSFSSMLSLKSREATPDERTVVGGYQQVPFETQGVGVGQPSLGVESFGAEREVAPPPKEPPICGVGNYRITTKKKAYAQIPGLSSGDARPTPLTSTFPPNIPQHANPPNPPINQVDGKITESTALNIFGDTEANKNLNSYAIFNPADNPMHNKVTDNNVFIDAKTFEHKNSHSVFNPAIISHDSKEVLSFVTDTKANDNLNLISPVQFSTENSNKTQPSQVEQHGERVEINNSNMAVQGSIIPPPPMFSNQRKDSSTSIGKSILPPSVARRISKSAKPPPSLQTFGEIFVPQLSNESNYDPTLPSIQQVANVSETNYIQPPPIFAPNDKLNPEQPAFLNPNMSETFGSNYQPEKDIKSNLQVLVCSSSMAANPLCDIATQIFDPIRVPDTMTQTKTNSSIVTSTFSVFTPMTLVNTQSVVTTSNQIQQQPFVPTAATTVPKTNVFDIQIGEQQGLMLPSFKETFTPKDYESSETKNANPILPPPNSMAQIFVPTLDTQQISTQFQPAIFNPMTISPQAGNEQAPFEPKPEHTESKTLTEPPKVVGMNFRLAKNKRPQYYSGSIEGVGAVSNNAKPMMNSIETTGFHGTVFNPENVSNITQQQSFAHFDITKAGENSNSSINEFKSNEQVYPPSFNTAFDFSRTTTDNYEVPKEEKTFGIIGSLKSKLSSLDINKIQNSVTTFFDPDYNNTRKDAVQDTAPYKQDFPSCDQYNTNNLEIFVPSNDAKPGQLYDQQSGYHNTTTYDTGYHHQTYNPPISQCSSGYNYFSFQDPATSTSNYFTEQSLSGISQSKLHLDYQNSAVPDYPSTNSQKQIMNVDLPIYVDAISSYFADSNRTFSPKDGSEITELKETDNVNLANSVAPDYPSTISQKQIFNVDLPICADAISSYFADINRTFSPKDASEITELKETDNVNLANSAAPDYPSTISQKPIFNVDLPMCADAISSYFADSNRTFSPKDASEITELKETDNVNLSLKNIECKHSSHEFKPEELSERLSALQLSQEKDIRVISTHDNVDKVGELDGKRLLEVNLKKNTDRDDVIASIFQTGEDDARTEDYFGVKIYPIKSQTRYGQDNSQTRSFNPLSLFSDDPTEINRVMPDFSGLGENVLSEKRSEDTKIIKNASGLFYQATDPVMNEIEGSDLSICETCREVNKIDAEEKEPEDLTDHLIENITSQIQLSNPVVSATLSENNTATGDFNEGHHCQKLSHIEEAIETIQGLSAMELLGDNDLANITNYGWNVDSAASKLNDYEDIETCLPDNFFDNITNASDEVKAELKAQEDFPTNLPIQKSIPTAPSAENLDEESDDTGDLDVQSIEQDAKKDFPLFDEYVTEPSGTDDDKIEYKERRTSGDTDPELDTFTRRVEKFQINSDALNPSVTLTSYFDTGNYAADTHFQKSLYLERLGYNINTFRIPPGFEHEYEAKLCDLANIATLKDFKDELLPSPGPVPLQVNSIQEFDVENILDNIQQETAHMKMDEIAKLPEVSNVCKSVLDGGLDRENKDTVIAYMATSLTELEDKMKSDHKVLPDTDKVTDAKQLLPDPMNFFESSTHKPEGDGDFNRLASYFSTSPTKTDNSKSFFELSQGQDHYRQKNLVSSEKENTKNSKNNNNITETRSNSIENVPINQYLANIELMKDLTSYQNMDIPKEQIVRTVNYFTIEYDVDAFNLKMRNPEKSLNKTSKIKNNPCQKSVDGTVEIIKDALVDIKLDSSNKIAHSLNNEKTDVLEGIDDENIADIVSNCKSCSVHSGINVNDRVLQAMYGPSEGKRQERDDNMSDNKEEATKETVRIDLNVNSDNDSNDSVTVVTQTRSSSEYIPVKYHWFYRVDSEGKSLWKGFSVVDSSALEEAFRRPDLDEHTVVATDGGRFDVNIVGRLKTAVYWSEKPTNVRRCSWFYKGTSDARYVPYSEVIAEKLEAEYRHGMTTNEWHRQLTLPSNEMVVMHGPNVIAHFLQASPTDPFGAPNIFKFGKRVYRNLPVGVTSDEHEQIDHLILMVHGAGEWRQQKKKIQSTARPRVVRRGHEESEVEDTEPSNIDHLLLLCHGVGSACDMRFRPVEEVVNDFRATSLQLIQSHYKNSYDNGIVGRVEVLPISWHSTLHTGPRGVDRLLSRITLDSIPMLRNFTNDTILDVLFYTSPVYCQTIINQVCSEMNRIYDLFKSRNPEFRGGISLGGHSLGSVVLYDLLSHQTNLPLYPVPPAVTKKLVKGAETAQPAIKYPKLEFSPDALFALGSPIAIFECVRGVESLGRQFALPTCKNFFNIFHPYDPIAYRIEPLISLELKDVKPVLIPHHKGRKRMHLELKETMTRVGADLKQRVMESIKATWASMWRTQPPKQSQLERVVEEEIEKESPLNQGVQEETLQEFEPPVEMLGRFNNGRRIDYVLQEAPFEIIYEYLFAMKSHVCYWMSEDTMLMILREIYSSMGVSADGSVSAPGMIVERTRTIRQDEVIVASSEIPSTSRGGT